MSGSPSVSVVIPVYNGTNYLSEAVRSVLDQTCYDYELVIVDDGSQDGTAALAESFSVRHPETVRVIAQQNGGTARALNTGIQSARGRYIAWLSHDDRFVPHKLETQLKWLEAHPDAVGVYSDYALIDSRGTVIGCRRVPWYPPPLAIRHLLQCVYVNGSTLLIERDVLFEEGLFDASIRYAHDAAMWVRLLQRYRLGHIAVPLTEYRVHAEQGTRNRRQIRKDDYVWLSRTMDREMAAIFPELGEADVPPQHIAMAHLYVADVAAACHRQFGLAFRHYAAAARLSPGLSGTVIQHMFSQAGRSLLRKGRQVIRAYRGRDDENRADYGLLGEVDLRTFAEQVPDVRFGAVSGKH